MGVLLDSTVLIAAERAGKNPRNVIEEVLVALGDTEATLSVVTIIELAHGIERANSSERRSARERFLDELLGEISPEQVTVPIALRAGRLDGSLQAQGTRVVLSRPAYRRYGLRAWMGCCDAQRAPFSEDP